MFKQTLRTLRRSRGVTLLAIVALALGIGANTAIFSIVNTVFLRPLPYPESGRLVTISEANTRGGGISVSYPNFQDWEKQSSAFESLSAVVPNEATLESRAPAERMLVTYVSATFLQTLRIRPQLGRDFRPEDDRQNASPVAILSHAIWQTHFGADPGILGTVIRLDQRSYTVVGILPPEFRYYRGAKLLVPISDTVVRMNLHRRENHNNLDVIARLKPGVTLAQAQSQLDTITSRLERAYPATNTGIGARILSLRERLSGPARQPVTLLLAAVSLVLLIACVNVANLLLARASDRRKEMAVRAALGASRWHVLRQLLLESVMLAVAGGALGILIASWSFAALSRLVPASLDTGGLGIDFRVLGYTLLLSILTGVLFGLAPALEAWRLNLTDAMRDGGRTTGSASTARLRDGLAVAELALALVLLVGAGLLLRTLHSLMNVPLGFSTDCLLTARVSLPDSDEYTPVRVAAFFENLVAKAQNVPGVLAAGATSHRPMGRMFSSMVWSRDDRPTPARGKLPSADQRIASPQYFATMGIPLLRGRLFTPADGRVSNFRREEMMEWARKTRFSVVISESMAKRYWPGEDPVGKSFRPGFPEMGFQPAKILGVVADVRDNGPAAEMAPTFYWSAYAFPRPAMTLVMRTRGGDPGALVPAVRRMVASLDPAAMITDVATADQVISDAVAPRRLNMQLLGIFAALALVLAAVGIYGVMAYTVSRRSREIGVRMALGADRANVLRMVIGRAARLAALGVLIGSAAAFGLTRLISGMLYGVKGGDPLTFLAVAVLLFAVTIAASAAPALRATRVSPINALRSE